MDGGLTLVIAYGAFTVAYGAYAAALLKKNITPTPPEETEDDEGTPQRKTKVGLPRYAVFKSEDDSTYLTCTHGLLDNKDLISFSGDSVLSPQSKFVIEVAAIGNGQLVHVRSCYNYKYLVLHSSSGSIVAGAAKPEEDLSKGTCTLFEPLFVDSDNKQQFVRFRHVQTGYFVDKQLSAQSNSASNTMEVINWDSLVIFPSHGRLAFKGSNGRYLGGDDVDRYFQQFSVDDKNKDLASYTVFPAKNGDVQVYSRHFKKHWSVGSKGWIKADKHGSKYPETFFTPIKIDSNTIAFRSVANNFFLCLLDMNGKKCLNASATTMTDPTRITVEEVVMSRNIYNIVYGQEHGRIYDETPIVCGTGAATNDSNQEDTMAILVEYTETKSTSWETSISLSLGVKTTIKVGVPFIADGKIKFDANVTGGHKWGGKEDVSLKMSTTYTAKIGAKKQVKVSYVASKGTCNVPFSYTQEDVFPDGTRKVTVCDDGMFTGINCYNYSFIKQEDQL